MAKTRIMLAKVFAICHKMTLTLDRVAQIVAVWQPGCEEMERE